MGAEFLGLEEWVEGLGFRVEGLAGVLPGQSGGLRLLLLLEGRVRVFGTNRFGACSPKPLLLLSRSLGLTR